MPVNLGNHDVEVGAGESPVERLGYPLVIALKREQPGFEFSKNSEVVGDEQLALDDGEVDLDLVEL